MLVSMVTSVLVWKTSENNIVLGGLQAEVRGRMKTWVETGIKNDCGYKIDMYDGCIVMLTTSLKSHESFSVLQAKSNESLLGQQWK
jgi:hypothetical protein